MNRSGGNMSNSAGAKADCHSVCMRTLDRALYKFSKCGAATALKTITDDMFFRTQTPRV